jgi:hypothetical protein
MYVRNDLAKRGYFVGHRMVRQGGVCDQGVVGLRGRWVDEAHELFRHRRWDFFSYFESFINNIL